MGRLLPMKFALMTDGITSYTGYVDWLIRLFCLTVRIKRGWKIPEQKIEVSICFNMGVSENSVPLNPMVLLIIIPTKWL